MTNMWLIQPFCITNTYKQDIFQTKNSERKTYTYVIQKHKLVTVVCSNLQSLEFFHRRKFRCHFHTPTVPFPTKTLGL